MEKKTNQMSCNKLLAYSVRSGKYLPKGFSDTPRSFVAWSVRKPQVNTSPYGPRCPLVFNNSKSSGRKFADCLVMSQRYESFQEYTQLANTS